MNKVMDTYFPRADSGEYLIPDTDITLTSLIAALANGSSIDDVSAEWDLDLNLQAVLAHLMTAVEEMEGSLRWYPLPAFECMNCDSSSSVHIRTGQPEGYMADGDLVCCINCNAGGTAMNGGILW